MNLHLLEHLVDCVINWGPLWSYTCFVFETMNFHIKKLFHGTKDMTQQVCVHYWKLSLPTFTCIIHVQLFIIYTWWWTHPLMYHCRWCFALWQCRVCVPYHQHLIQHPEYPLCWTLFAIGNKRLIHVNAQCLHNCTVIKFFITNLPFWRLCMLLAYKLTSLILALFPVSMVKWCVYAQTCSFKHKKVLL